jgi:hypothetical protein
LSVATNLDQLNKNILALSDQLAEMKTDMKLNQKTQDKRMSHLETSMLHMDSSMSFKHADLLDKHEAKFVDYDKTLKSAKRVTQKNVTEIEGLKKTIHDQQVQIQNINELVTKNAISSKAEIQEVLRLANNVEAHQRRWSVRLLGLNAPDENGETSDQAKYLTLVFIHDILYVDNVGIEDVDCAHRVGKIYNGKQTMLIRVFSRNLTQHILLNKKNLKETQYVLYEDSTTPNPEG